MRHTGLHSQDIVPLPYDLVTSFCTTARVGLLAYCVYEARSIEFCQKIGDYYDGNIHHVSVHTIDYYFAYCKGPIREVCVASLDYNQFQILIKSLLRRQLQHNDDLVLYLPHCTITHQSCEALQNLLAVQFLITEFHIIGLKFQSIIDDVTSTHLSNMQALIHQ